MPPEGGAQDDAKSRVFASFGEENRSLQRRETIDIPFARCAARRRIISRMSWIWTAI